MALPFRLPASLPCLTLARQKRATIVGRGTSHLTRRRVVIRGHVQGVFFRDTTRRRAAGRGVTGWVRNNPDGTLEAVFEGEPEAVEDMVRFAREGPRGAIVEKVEVIDEEPEGLSGFGVR